MAFEETIKKVRSAGRQFVKDLQERLERKNSNASYSLSKSLRFTFEVNPTFMSFILYGNNYWKYIDKGVNGTQIKYGSPYSRGTKLPPIEPLIRWIEVRNLDISPFALQKSIHRTGITPTFVFSDGIKEFEEKSKEIIIEAYKQDVLNELKDKDNGNNS